jgi:hypothetical protein
VRIAIRALLVLLALACMSQAFSASPPGTAVATEAPETYGYDATAHNAPARAIEAIESRDSVRQRSVETATTSRGIPFLDRAGVATKAAAPRFVVSSAGEALDTARITIPGGKYGYLLENPSKSGVSC